MSNNSKCPKCEGTSFDAEELETSGGTSFRLGSVYCRSCKTIVGIINYTDSLRLEKVRKKVQA